MSHDTLANYLETNFAMVQFHGWSGEYLDAVVPYERDAYVGMLQKHLAEEAERRRLLELQHGGGR